MSRVVYVNGSFVPENEGKVSIFDRGFLFADGVYEVTAVINGRLVDYDPHAERLDRSLKEIQMAWPCSKAELRQMHEEPIKRNKLDEGDQPAAGERVALDGYASSKPRLGSNSVAKVDEHKDLDPKQIIKDVKKEIKDMKEEIAKANAAPEPAAPDDTAPKAEKPAQSGLPPGMIEDLKKVGSVTPAGTQYHTVTEKETLYSISRRYNVTVAQLQQWNNLQHNGIRIGQQLVVRK